MKAIALVLFSILGAMVPASEQSESLDQVAYFDYTAFFYDADGEIFYFIEYNTPPSEQLSKVMIKSYDATSGVLIVQDLLADATVKYTLDESIHGIGSIKSEYAKSVLLKEVDGQVKLVSRYDLRDYQNLKCSCQIINSDGLDKCQSGGRGSTSASLGESSHEVAKRSISIVCGPKHYPCCN